MIGRLGHDGSQRPIVVVRLRRRGGGVVVVHQDEGEAVEDSRGVGEEPVDDVLVCRFDDHDLRRRLAEQARDLGRGQPEVQGLENGPGPPGSEHRLHEGDAVQPQVGNTVFSLDTGGTQGARERSRLLGETAVGPFPALVEERGVLREELRLAQDCGHGVDVDLRTHDSSPPVGSPRIPG